MVAVGALAFGAWAPAAYAAEPTSAAAAVGAPAAAQERADVVGVPFRFVAFPYEVRDLPPQRRPFALPWGVPRVDVRLHDAAGVRMRKVNGRVVNAPGTQAQYGVQNLNSYRLTGDRLFLERAMAQAERLIERRVQVGAAWFFPSRYTYRRHGKSGDLMRPPWYSAMAQGHALALFVQLGEITGEARYVRAAEATFAGFLRRGPRRGPWVVCVDASGYLWLEEWPKRPTDHTLNGHILAAWGVYEYYRTSGDPRALQIFRGAATTVQRYARRFRRPGWISRYCLRHGGALARYHDVHIWQLQRLHTITGDVRFARLAEAFYHDYPPPQLAAEMVLTAGRHRVYRFDRRGRISGRRTLRLGADRRVKITRRARIRTRAGVWLRMTSGPGRGFWVREAAGRAYVPGLVAPLGASPDRHGTWIADEVTGRAFTGDGSVRAEKTLPGMVDGAVELDCEAVINGAVMLRVCGGPFSGYWVSRDDVRLE